MTEGDASPLRLFQGHGVELEYMLVRIDDLAVVPISDRVLQSPAGEITNEVEVEEVSWSNELVLHVMELKNTVPAPALGPLGDLFSEHVKRMNATVEPMGAMLMPGAMHPLMRPRDETRIWPHEGREIYEAFHRVFDCRRHGWANLQSAQLNLWFGDDEEFGRLHAAIRLVLPVVAALAASSPIVEGELTGIADSRLEVYRTNGGRVPATTGEIIPEPIFGRAEYEKLVYEPMYREIEAHDPEGTLRHPWLNARGAIPKFGLGAIEVRILDVQECPQADIAIASAVTAVLKALVGEVFCDYGRQRAWETAPLAEIFLATLRSAEKTVIRNHAYLKALAFPDRDGTARDLWLYLVEALGLDSPHLRVILDHGPLSRRIVNALG
ncbi:MAG: carboxylate-amine ligase, partial [Vicinamibacteria bacterium]